MLYLNWQKDYLKIGNVNVFSFLIKDYKKEGKILYGSFLSARLYGSFLSARKCKRFQKKVNFFDFTIDNYFKKWYKGNV